MIRCIEEQLNYNTNSKIESTSQTLKERFTALATTLESGKFTEPHAITNQPVRDQPVLLNCSVWNLCENNNTCVLENYIHYCVCFGKNTTLGLYN